MPEIITKATVWTKESVWKYFGAAFMETKNGKQAISLTRSLSLLCFGYMSYLWLTATEDSEVPDKLLYTFFVLLGGKTLEAMLAIWKGKKGQ